MRVARKPRRSFVKTFADCLLLEIAIAIDGETRKLMPFAAIDPIGDGVDRSASFRLTGSLRISAEIPLRLKVLLDVTLAFFQQIRVHGLLLKNGNELSQTIPAYARALHHNLDRQAGLNIQIGLYGVVSAVVLQLSEIHL